MHFLQYPGFLTFFIVLLAWNIDSQFLVILCSNIVSANSSSVFINKSGVATKAEVSLSSSECFLLKSDNLKFANVFSFSFGYGLNNDLDFEINWVLIESSRSALHRPHKLIQNR